MEDSLPIKSSASKYMDIKEGHLLLQKYVEPSSFEKIHRSRNGLL
jgi:hypothetical protein